jgi:hypothetical protein
VEEAEAIAARIGYPVLMRPVVRARRPRHGDRVRRRDAAPYMAEAVEVSETGRC